MEQNGTGAEMLGFHLEGPFIHPEQAGAQPVEFIREPSFQLLNNWFGETSRLFESCDARSGMR